MFLSKWNKHKNDKKWDYHVVEGFDFDARQHVPDDDVAVMTSAQQDPRINRIMLKNKDLISMALKDHPKTTSNLYQAIPRQNEIHYQYRPHPFVLYVPLIGGTSLSLGLGQLWLI